VVVPVSIAENPGLVTFQTVITYDPTVLTPISVDNGPVWSGDIVYNLNYDIDQVFAAGSSASMRTGDGAIFNIEFAVDPKAADGAYPITVEVMELKTLNAQYTQLDIPRIVENGVVTFKRVIRGNVTGSGVVSASDATEVLLYIARLKELAEWQLLAADMRKPIPDGLGISAADATEILLVVARLKDPPITPGAGYAPLSPAEPGIMGAAVPGISAARGSVAMGVPSVELSLGAASGSPGDVVTVPVRISGNTGFSTFTFYLEYDNAKLELLDDIASGPAWPGEIVYNPAAQSDSGDRFAILTGASGRNRSSDGEIAYVSFRVLDGAEAGDACISLSVQELKAIDPSYEQVDVPFLSRSFDALTMVTPPVDTVVAPPAEAVVKTVIVGGVELEIREASGIAMLSPTKEQMGAILKAAGNDIVIDLREYAGIDFRAAAEWFKDVDKTITFVTSKGSDTVKTKTLWNNSGKDRVIEVRNGKASVKND